MVLPLGFGIVTGILLLNSFGHLVARRRIIELGLVTLGVLLMILAVAGPIARFLQRAETATGLVSLADFTSLLAVVVFVALLAGIAYACVAIPAQTQLQEDLPEDVRGRVFGILNMLVSVSSFLPIIIVGPVSDLVGTIAVIIVVAALITFAGVASILTRGALKPAEQYAAPTHGQPAGIDMVAVVTASELETGDLQAMDRPGDLAVYGPPFEAHGGASPGPRAGTPQDEHTLDTGTDAPTGARSGSDGEPPPTR